MIICEFEFSLPDKEDPNYARSEVDYYSHVPYDAGFRQHRLSLRKNLITGKFEIYRAYAKSHIVSRGAMTMMQEKETGLTEVVYSGDLQGAIDFATKETNRFWAKVHGYEKKIDEVCLHKKPVQHWLCQRFQEETKKRELAQK